METPAKVRGRCSRTTVLEYRHWLYYPQVEAQKQALGIRAAAGVAGSLKLMQQFLIRSDYQVLPVPVLTTLLHCLSRTFHRLFTAYHCRLLAPARVE